MDEATISTRDLKLLRGQCPKEDCCTTVHFPSYVTNIKCTSCFEYDSKIAFNSTDNRTLALEDVLWKEVEKMVYRDKDDDKNLVTSWADEAEKSNFLQRLIAPLLSRYIVNKENEPVKISTISESEELDCALAFKNRAFLVNSHEKAKEELRKWEEDDHIAATLSEFNDGEIPRLVPVSVETGSQGFFHALSVSLVGREMYWYALQTCFYRELKNNGGGTYEEYVTAEEWKELLQDYNPDSVSETPVELKAEVFFIMANVLKRPIILLKGPTTEDDDNISGVFLPMLFTAKACEKRCLCFAWVDEEQTRLIPVVGVKDNTTLPLRLLPEAWKFKGTDKELKEYIYSKKVGGVNIGGKALKEDYLKDLSDCMLEKQFSESYGVGPMLVEAVYRSHFKPSGMVDIPVDTVASIVKSAYDDLRVYRCLDCKYTGIVPRYLVPDGQLYKKALDYSQQKLNFEKKYCFISLGFQGKVDGTTLKLMAIEKLCRLLTCPVCRKTRMRKVTLTGEAVMKDGDLTNTGKYFWKGRTYSQKPKVIPIGLQWKDSIVPSNIEWHYDEPDEELNSTVEGVVQILKENHFKDETDERVTERIRQLVKLRLEQQQDLDIPGIEKRKPPVLPANTPLDPTALPMENDDSSDGNSSSDESSEDEDDDLFNYMKKSKMPKTTRTADDVDDNMSSGSVGGSSNAGKPATSSSLFSVDGAQDREVSVRDTSGKTLGSLRLPANATYQKLVSMLESEFGLNMREFEVKYGVPPNVKTINRDSKEDVPLTMLKDKDVIRLQKLKE